MIMRNPFQRAYSSEELAVFNFLSQVQLFKKLTHDEMAHFLPYLYSRKYKQNEVVFFRKDPSQALYILKQGEVMLSMDMQDDLEPFNSLSVHDSFGNNALLQETHRAYHAVVTSEKAEILVVPYVNIADIFDGQLKIRAKMMESLAEIYHEYTLKLINTYQKDKGFFNLNDVPINF